MRNPPGTPRKPAQAGPVALVTGASRVNGLGAAIALALASAGHAVALCGGRDREALEANAAAVREAGSEVLALSCDLTDDSAVSLMAAEVVRHYRRLDVLVNCASGRGDYPLLELPLEEWRRVLSVNLDGAFHCIRAVAPQMIRQHHGRIINIASISGQAGDPNRAHVVTAKAGLIGLTKAAAKELGVYGITVNAVSPGLIATPRDSGAGLAQRLKRIEESPLRRPGASSDIAAACAYLASPGAGFITGQTLSVNGGAWMA